jgi:LL-diaminopimelate aminotransferase
VTVPGTGRGVGAARLARVPEYHFAGLRKRIAALRASGVDVVSLDVGDPDLPAPPAVVEAAVTALGDPANHRYPGYAGLDELRVAIARWYARRFGVELDARAEVLPVLGSKEAIAHLPLALLDPGDVALCPDPGYPVYVSATILAGGEPVALPLRPDHGFTPDLGAVPADVLSRARLLWLNYPNNPTGAVAPAGLLEEAVGLCRRHSIVLVHDAPYTEIAEPGYRAPSVLEVPGSREVAVELHSLSKTYDMTGWRIGMAVGNAEVLSLLAQVKSNVDTGVFQVVQRAAIAALDEPAGPLAERNRIVRARIDRLVPALRAAGATLTPPRATFYLWARVPDGFDSISWSQRLLDEARVSVTPGVFFGSGGAAWVRASVTAPDERIDEACARLRAFGGGC